LTANPQILETSLRIDTALANLFIASEARETKGIDSMIILI
jgi:hypothetical protein